MLRLAFSSFRVLCVPFSLSLSLWRFLLFVFFVLRLLLFLLVSELLAAIVTVAYYVCSLLFVFIVSRYATHSDSAPCTEKMLQHWFHVTKVVRF